MPNLRKDKFTVETSYPNDNGSLINCNSAGRAMGVLQRVNALGGTCEIKYMGRPVTRAQLEELQQQDLSEEHWG